MINGRLINIIKIGKMIEGGNDSKIFEFFVVYICEILFLLSLIF